MAEKVARAEFISTISHYASSQVMKASDPAHWHKVRTLRLGVDSIAFSPRPPPNKQPGEPFRLVMVGRLAPAKAQHILIRMVAALKSSGRNVELTLVGAGPSHDSLAALVRDLKLEKEVVLAGACNHDKVADFYRRSDAFVLASFAEGVPVVLMEAMAMELPCISTWITGVPELITQGVDGVLVPPASVEALADAVVKLMDDTDLARRIGPAGRRKVMASYDLASNARKLGELLSSLGNAGK
jgi:glycosyltransferase involved in cell wall biosynthesis